MGFYRRFILPHIVDLAMRNEAATARRSALVPKASGAVLEIGIGSGLNLPFYRDGTTHVCGVDPSRELLGMAGRKLAGLGVGVELISGSAEELPFGDRSFDTAVMTWTLCSVPNPVAALAEIRRTLRPDGFLLLVEHGLSRDSKIQAWQNRLTPIWRRVAGGCHLNRKVDELLAAAGFRIVELRTSYLPGPKPMTFTYEGIARPA